jgi:hypothetical protein
MEVFSSELRTTCPPILLGKVWNLFREPAESSGTEEERFNALFESSFACRCIEAENEAEGNIGVLGGWRRDEVVFDRRIGFAGGVGGVAIQVGVDAGNSTHKDVQEAMFETGVEELTDDKKDSRCK